VRILDFSLLWPVPDDADQDEWRHDTHWKRDDLAACARKKELRRVGVDWFLGSNTKGKERVTLDTVVSVLNESVGRSEELRDLEVGSDGWLANRKEAWRELQ
jgi:hypothetical protein